jgi:hypothetical protein
MRGWARALLVTTGVAVLPVAIVWALWAFGVVSPAWTAAPLAVALVLLASFAGAAYWKRRPATGDVLFSDLLLWGWFRRTRAERRLADAVELLGRVGAADEAEKLQLLKRVAIALDAKDPYLEGHSQRVARFSSVMAGRLHVSHEEAVRIETAAVIHDVGKLHVPPEVLTKPGRLTPDETLVMRRHADEGAELVACLGDPTLSDIVRHHHERFDGFGYPAGLAGDTVPLGARIVAVADTFDAITSARPYRPARTHKRALDILEAEAGTQLDPAVVRAFVSEYNRRRGLALWALLAVPIARTRRQPLPAAAVVGGLVLIGVTAMAVLVGGGEGRTSGAAAAGPTPVASVPVASPQPTRKSSARPRRKAVTSPARRGSGPHVRLASAVTTPQAGSRPPATRRVIAAAPTRTPSPQRAAPRAVATPRPNRSRRRAPTPPRAPTPRRKPPAATPRAPTPRAPTPTPIPKPRSTPTPLPTSAPPSTPTSPEQCKNGGYAKYGYRNQGQCVSAQHKP